MADSAEPPSGEELKVPTEPTEDTVVQKRRGSVDSYDGYGKALDDYSEYDESESMAAESVATASHAGGSTVSKASRGSRLDAELKEAINLVKASDQKIGALRKMHAQYLLKRVEDALGGGALDDDNNMATRLLGVEHEREAHRLDRDTDSSSDEDDPSLADSAFVYKSQAALKYGGNGAGPDFTRLSARLEKDLGLGGDTESLMGYKAAAPQLGAGSVISDGEALQYTAAAFNGHDLETGSIFSKDDSLTPDEEKWRRRFRRRVKINWVGTLIFLFYLLALGFYMWVRITKTLDLGAYLWYGVLILVVEVMGSTTTILYGVNLLLNPVPHEVYKQERLPGRKWSKWRRKAAVKEQQVEPSGDSVASSASDGSSMSGTTQTSGMSSLMGGLSVGYHVRVLIPCYQEDFDLVKRTLLAARDAGLPAGCSRTVYLLDDGKDKKKRKWASRLGPDVVYVSGRHRAADESNGKSGNLNNALQQIYPDGAKIPSNEVVCIFDADQVADPTFFMKMLPLMDDGDDIAMVLSPQCFHNVHHQCDIFNHTNIHFWEYMQVGYDALGFISCTGTNFLIRANAFAECGWSPSWTLTEDFALGMELKKRGWQCRYMREYLAVGEAPEQVRNCFQQKSRWCKGHFQVLFSNEHCPLFQEKLSWLQRIMYCQGVWSYIVGAISTPTFVLVPLATIWFGIFPIVLNWWAAVGLTTYYVATNLVLSYCRNRKHIYPLWFSNIANQIMWWTYVKAFWRGVAGASGAKITFKTTLKGSGRIMASLMSDLWMPCLLFILLLVSFIIGILKLVHSATIQNTLAISLVWVLYNMLPQYLLLHYTYIGRGSTMQFACRMAFILTTLLGVGAMVLIWLLYPVNYNYATGLKFSHQFYQSQQVGAFTGNENSWRHESLLQEYAIPFSGKNFNLGGGYMEGSSVGTVKVTMPLAWVTSMLAWGALDFQDGYNSSGQYETALINIKWSTDYLLKLIVGSPSDPANIKLIYQVGNETEDSMSWSRPEDITSARPFYYVPVKYGTTDLLGQMIGAFASTATLFQVADPAYYDELMSWALTLYGVATGVYDGLYLEYLQKPQCIVSPAQASLSATARVQALNCNPGYYPLNGSVANIYNSTTMNDDVAWAATWMYRATGDQNYLNDAISYLQSYEYSNENVYAESLLVDWNNNYYNTAILLAQLTDQLPYHYVAQNYLKQWICSSSNIITYTKRGRAWNSANGNMGTTATAVMMAAAYGKAVRVTYPAQSQRYICWAQSQMRYMLGEVGFGFVVGFGVRSSQYPTHAQDRGASCPNPPTTCNWINGYYNPNQNPHLLKGALVEGPVTGSDTYADVRSANESRVSIEYNAGFTGALAALNEVVHPSWDQCLQGWGVLSTDPVCSK